MADRLPQHISRFSGGGKAIAKVYEPFAKRVGFPVPNLPSHPDTRTIVAGASIDRRRTELTEASPEIIITLGEAAFSVMRTLLDRHDPKQFPRDEEYGTAINAPLGGFEVSWYPLLHPGQRDKRLRSWHRMWMEGRL